MERNVAQYSLKKVADTTSFGITGISILCLYPIFIWFVVATLSAHSFQNRVALIIDKDEQQAMSVQQLIRQYDELEGLRATQDLLRLDIVDLMAKREAAEQALQDMRDEREQVSLQLDDLYVKIKLLLRNNGQLNDIEDSKITFEMLRKAAETLSVEHDDVRKMWADYLQTDNKLANAERRLDNDYWIVQSKIGEIDTRVSEKEAKNIEAGDKVQEILKKRNISDALSDLDYLKRLSIGSMEFATMPNQLLTIILTLVMGALGSLIYITRSFFQGPDKNPLSWYLFRPFLGMVTAIAVLILAKAGQITISDVSVADGARENLNPFFVSFLAIISGLVSEQAIEKIKRAASGIFGEAESSGEDKRNRWARNVRDVIDRRNMNVAELAQYLDKSDSEIIKWLNEEKPVPKHDQIIIASWLGVPIRDLFTDIPPVKAANDESVAA